MAEKKLCGHVNKHSLGTDRKPDEMKCDLPDGHAGNHQGVHIELQRVEDAQIVDGSEVISVRYEEVEVRRGWNDMAGVPVSEIPTPKEPSQPTMLELEKRVKELEQNGKWKPGQSLNEIQVARG